MTQTRSFFALNPEVSLSAGHDRMVVFARRAGGELAHIDQVDNGKACSCYCLACDEALIARQGEVREHSFAHQSGTQCSHALETMLHGVAVELISRRRQFRVPPLHVQASVAGPHGPIIDVIGRPGTAVAVDAVALERRPPWSRPCVVITVHGRELLIHVALNHAASAAKRQALAVADQAAVEIDFTRHFPHTVGELARALFDDDHRTSWLFNPREAALRTPLQAQLQARAEEQWRAHQTALQAQQALREQHEREHAEHVRQLLAAAAERERLREDLQERAAAWQATQAESPSPPAPPAPPRQPRPAELSPSVEYTSAQGRLWLLHSAQPEIHLRAEPGMEPVLDILRRFGAVPDAAASGVYRISRSGWSSAALEFGRCWTAIRSVS